MFLRAYDETSIKSEECTRTAGISRLVGKYEEQGCAHCFYPFGRNSFLLSSASECGADASPWCIARHYHVGSVNNRGATFEFCGRVHFEHEAEGPLRI